LTASRSPKGEKVTILSHGDSEAFQVSPEEKRLLLESVAQADRGEFVDADELLADDSRPCC